MNGEANRMIHFVGFAGHRRVEDPAAAKRSIKRELERLKEGSDGELAGIASAAAGADLLFLEACGELELKTVVILPFGKERFREDFDDPAEWRRACDRMDAAWWLETAPGGEDAPEAYHVVAREVLEVADRMIFLWDGQPARGLGGTAESIAEAKEHGIPSRVINANTLEADWLDRVPQAGVKHPSFEDLPEAASVAELFERLDERAGRGAPRSRGFAAASLSLNHLAGVTQAVMVAFSVLTAQAGALLKLVLVTVASVLPKVGKRLRWQQQWVNDRVRAELLRSLLATHEPCSPLYPPALELFGRERDFLRSASMRLVPERKDWQSARDRYLADRLDGQIRYLKSKGDLAGRRMRIFGRIFTAASVGAVVFGAAVVILAFMGLKPWDSLSFAADVLPGVAAWLLAMISVFEFKRRATLYHQMVRELERVRPVIASARCASEVVRGMRQAERLLLNELWEWRGSREK